jgi:hypothetical protein
VSGTWGFLSLGTNSFAKISLQSGFKLRGLFWTVCASCTTHRQNSSFYAVALEFVRLLTFYGAHPPRRGTLWPQDFDSRLRRELCRLLPSDGYGFSDTHWRVAGLPLSSGGLGLPSATLLLQSAYLDSYTSTIPLERRLLPPGIPAPSELPAALTQYQTRVPGYSLSSAPRPSVSSHDSTTSLGAAVMAAERADLLTQLDHKSSALLLSSSLPQAFAWLLALPDCRYQLTMDPLAFRCRLAYHLGLPLFHPHQACRFCSSPMDAYGDHALHCGVGRGASHTFRHHRVRDCVRRLLVAAGFTTTSEPPLPFSSVSSGPVRADLLVQQWSGGRDLYLDFVGVSPLTSGRLAAFSPGRTAASAAASKGSHYASFQAANDGHLDFVPFAF